MAEHRACNMERKVVSVLFFLTELHAMKVHYVEKVHTKHRSEHTR
jgi:hypothetical protein